jgi:hypothetical protein
MKGGIQIQINEINRLMNYDRSKTLLEQGSADFMVDRMSMSKAGVNYKDYKDVNSVDINKLSSLLCGDDSPFAGLFEIPWIEYKSEELFCDVLAGLLMAFGPFGIMAGLSVEFLHAKDLWNKGDKLGAWISMTIGLLPIIGDVGGKGLRVLIKKIGSSGITKVGKILILIIKFLSGEVKASTLIRAKKALSTDERKMLYTFLSTSGEIISKVSKLGDEFSKISSRLDELGIGFIDDSIEKIVDVINSGNWLSKLFDTFSQTSSIMTAIFGVYFVESILACDSGDNSFEAFDQQIEDSYNMLQQEGDDKLDDLIRADMEYLGIEPINNNNTDENVENNNN